jgi:hypothetical protein
MTHQLYRYTFVPDTPLQEVEASLLLSLLAVEALHGESQTLLDAIHTFDRASRSYSIDAGTVVGRDLNRFFVNFLRREFGETAFQIERVTEVPQPQTLEANP